LTLIAFGADSIIELLSAGVILWRLYTELRQDKEFSEDTERRAAKIGAALLIALALYVVVSAAWSLWHGAGQEFSVPGLVLAILALPIMYFLVKAKLRLAEALASPSLRTDAIESIACGYLSGVVIIGLLTQLVVSAWWIDGASALVLTPFLVREAHQAWEGENA